jgi:hypothetical protein
MMRAKLWRARKQRIEKAHEWRPRRSRFGELVQWDTSDHDWMEGRGEEILLINMIDDATGRWFARFVDSDSTVENMNHLERYPKQHGRPLAYYTDNASIFQTAEKTKRDGSRLGKSREQVGLARIHIVTRKDRGKSRTGILATIQAVPAPSHRMTLLWYRLGGFGVSVLSRPRGLANQSMMLFW